MPWRVTILVMPPRIGPRTPARVFLAEWRDHYGVSQEALGLRFDPPVDKGTISRWEAIPKGLSIHVVQAYAEALDPDLDWTMLGRLPPKDGPKDDLAAVAGHLEEAVDLLRRRSKG